MNEHKDMKTEEEKADALAVRALEKMGIDSAPPPPRKNSSFVKLGALLGGVGGDKSISTKRDSFSVLPSLPSLDDDAEVVIDDRDTDIGWGDDEKDEDNDDDAFDVMVGTCPFLDRQIAAFVRLGSADIIGELAEEGYRTRDLFLCLGPSEDSEEVWQIGRSFAVLMSQEEFAERIDSATSKEDVIATVDTFIDQSVIIPNPNKVKDFGRTSGVGSEAHSDHGDDSVNGRLSDHELGPGGDWKERRSTSTHILSPQQVAELEKRNKPKTFFGKLFGSLTVTTPNPPSVSAVLERTVEVPQHVLLQQRRRQRIAQERNKQLIKFAAEAEAGMPAKNWTHHDKKMLSLITMICLVLVLTMVIWVGPALKEQHDGHHVHEVHMHGFAGEVGGLIGLAKDTSFEKWLEKGDNVAVFDVKAVAQVAGGGARSTRRRKLGGVEGEGDFVSIALWSSVDQKSCLDFPSLSLSSHEEAEMLETVVTGEDFDEGCSTMLTKGNAQLFYFNISTTSDIPVALMFQADGLPPHAKHRTVLSALLLCAVYICIVTDLVHRTLVAMIGAFLSLLLLATMNYHASMETAIVWMDEGTLALLFGMMIIVNLVSTTGLFEWVAIRALDMSGGYMTKLMVLLCVATALLSAFLDNVTTMLLLAPVTIELCNVIDMNPIAFLISEVMFSNIGGTATMIGDPPNIIIGNMLSEYVGFVDFIVNLAPCIIMSSFAPMFFLMWYYKDTFDVPKKEFDMEALKKKYSITDR